MPPEITDWLVSVHQGVCGRAGAARGALGGRWGRGSTAESVCCAAWPRSEPRRPIAVAVKSPLRGRASSTLPRREIDAGTDKLQRLLGFLVNPPGEPSV